MDRQFSEVCPAESTQRSVLKWVSFEHLVGQATHQQMRTLSSNPLCRFSSIIWSVRERNEIWLDKVKSAQHHEKRPNPGPRCVSEGRGNGPRYLQGISLLACCSSALPSTDLHVYTTDNRAPLCESRHMWIGSFPRCALRKVLSAAS